MSYVVTQRCAGSCHSECVSVCPCECFYRIDDPQMLVIEPEACIDCGACEAACPVQAIFHEDDVPERYQDAIALNAERWSEGEHQTEAAPPLAGARTLEEVLAAEATSS